MTDIQQAKEWAESRVNGNYLLSEGTKEAVKVIQSLPDQIVDGRRLRQIIDFQGTSISDDARKDLESLLTPPLPTLADMTPEEREACKWMQAQVFPTASTLGIITGVDEYARSAIILFADGMAKNVPWAFITPLPGEPKLEWPGSHADTITAESVEDVCNCRACNSEESSLPRLEDVPAGEPWIVKCDGHEWVGTRDSRVETVCSWALARLDGADFTVARDDDITLVSRLVPEVKP